MWSTGLQSGQFLNPNMLLCLCEVQMKRLKSLLCLALRIKCLIQTWLVFKREFGYLSRSVGTIPSCDGSVSGLARKHRGHGKP